jgi:hypothetical protein
MPCYCPACKQPTHLGRGWPAASGLKQALHPPAGAAAPTGTQESAAMALGRCSTISWAAALLCLDQRLLHWQSEGQRQAEEANPVPCSAPASCVSPQGSPSLALAARGRSRSWCSRAARDAASGATKRSQSAPQPQVQPPPLWKAAGWVRYLHGQRMCACFRH